jgi:hypothetical protein
LDWVIRIRDYPPQFLTTKGNDMTTVSAGRILDDNGYETQTQGTLLAGEDLTNNVLNTRRPMTYTNLSASALIKTGAGVVSGFIVNSHTSGTLKLWDNTSAATTVLTNTITFAAGSGIVVNFGSDIQFSTGLYATIGGTADITIFWK